MGIEQPSKYYDEIYQNSDEYRKNYKESIYYDLWAQVISILTLEEIESIIDLGCGVGQFADMLFDNGFYNYVGIDFSEVAIQKANHSALSQSHKFVCTDLANDNIYKQVDCYTLLETLEHLENDLDVLNKIPVGCFVIITVPSFDDPGHVRYFTTEDEVEARYNLFFNNCKVHKFDKWFILHGRKI